MYGFSSSRAFAIRLTYSIKRYSIIVAYEILTRGRTRDYEIRYSITVDTNSKGKPICCTGISTFIIINYLLFAAGAEGSRTLVLTTECRRIQRFAHIPL
jgi:hypothetical protein